MDRWDILSVCLYVLLLIYIFLLADDLPCLNDRNARPPPKLVTGFGFHELVRGEDGRLEPAPRPGILLIPLLRSLLITRQRVPVLGESLLLDNFFMVR